MRILSLFDGISCGMLALERAGIKVDKYYASEINKYAIKISEKNYPEIIQLGDIRNISEQVLDSIMPIDMIIGGSPCQDLTVYNTYIGDISGLKGKRSILFYEFVRILQYVKPKYFLLENVASMPEDQKDIISQILGVTPIMINSSLMCAAERKRLYWTNIPNVSQPQDKGIILKDIVEDVSNVPDKYWYTKYPVTVHEGDVKVKATIHIGNAHRQVKEVYNLNHKSNTIMCDGDGGNLVKKVYQDNRVRKLMPIEYERLQTLPDNYTDCVSDSRRYTAIGNGWTVDVIAHILSFIPKYSKVLKEEIIISKKENDYYKELLNMTGKEIYDKYGLKRDETITHTATFTNNMLLDSIEVDIQITIGDADEKPYVQGILFDGVYEACVDDCQESVVSSWEFEYQDVKYIVNVHVES